MRAKNTQNIYKRFFVVYSRSQALSGTIKTLWREYFTNKNLTQTALDFTRTVEKCKHYHACHLLQTAYFPVSKHHAVFYLELKNLCEYPKSWTVHPVRMDMLLGQCITPCVFLTFSLVRRHYMKRSSLLSSKWHLKCFVKEATAGTVVRCKCHLICG